MQQVHWGGLSNTLMWIGEVLPGIAAVEGDVVRGQQREGVVVLAALHTHDVGAGSGVAEDLLTVVSMGAANSVHDSARQV